MFEVCRCSIALYRSMQSARGAVRMTAFSPQALHLGSSAMVMHKMAAILNAVGMVLYLRICMQSPHVGQVLPHCDGDVCLLL